MASILDQKTRILDSIVTQEGRRQISAGKLRAEFYSFSDSGAFYDKQDAYASGSSKYGNGIAIPFQLEPTNLPQDRVTFEADDSGKLFVRELKNVNGTNVKIMGGALFSGSLYSGFQPVTGSTQFASLATGLLSSSIENFNKLMIIGSPDLFNTSRDQFVADPKSMTFSITDNAPILSQEKGGTQQANIDNVESLFADKRLSHVPNFQYLPPVNKPRLGSNNATLLAVFPRLGQRPVFEYSDLATELDAAEQAGFCQRVSFTETSARNRVFGQFFEVSSAGFLTKLDVIDFGTFLATTQITEDEYAQLQRSGKASLTKHVYFAGKLFVDSTGSHTFVNLFTLVFEN
jgi:hypothetical protein